MTLRRRRDVPAAPVDEKKRAAAAQLLEEK
jgi:hypothetical protein